MNTTKRQNFPSGLWVVGTPIGNLDDFSERARQVLSHVELILCEDTRRTIKLLNAMGINKPLERLDAYTTENKINRLVLRLKSGESFALVSDAGTPCISDPGARVVAAAHVAGIKVIPIPGASAITTLLSVSGFAETAFHFRGFFPRNNNERKHELERILSDSETRIFLWFESPERIKEVMEFISEWALSKNVEVSAVVGKELTKIHEVVFSGALNTVMTSVLNEISREGVHGEWCFALYVKNYKHEDETDLKNTGWFKALECLVSSNVSISDSAKKVSHIFGVSKNVVYKAAVEFLKKKC